MKDFLLIEQSVVSEFTKEKTNEKKEEYLKKILNSYCLDLNDTFVTNRQFLEFTGHGQARSLIKKNNRENLSCLKKITAEGSFTDSEIDKYIEGLDSLFDVRARDIIKRFKSDQLVKERTRKYPLSNILKPVESKMKKLGRELKKQYSSYEKFIREFVEDSVIRQALYFFNFREISPKHYEEKIEILHKISKRLLIKYPYKSRDEHNIILHSSALRSAIKSIKDQKSSIKPLYRIDDDYADIEVPYFMLYGKEVGEVLAPVTIITSESIESIKERIDYDIVGSGCKGEIYEAQKLCLGRIICVDFNEYTNSVITPEYLRKVKKKSGEPLF